MSTCTVSEAHPYRSHDRVSVAVHVHDRRVADDLLPALNTAPELRIAAPADSAVADVALVLTELVTDTVTDALTALSERATNPAQRTVLIAGPLRERHLPQIFAAGVVAILPRKDVLPRQVAHALIAAAHGRAVLPDKLTRWLADEIRFLQTNLLASQGLAAGGLTTREVDVLKLVAQGDDTAQIARQLNYSERTIKKITQELMSRLKLRNRAHAVSYALRVGAI
ncbi:DNA-binding response regulator, NarL/FixJ family, contains REC and HTH domains [Lentzea xinjiangensis]|uniref:DNA-binding response regulator, NarL/FixJ family, contains REC and HTH domains n=1 Tax=Lentzea xinjiangensis TaxID=402600 RepID=A0A1H9PEJ7_9PSEU|nr:response regulator transcription factor [Lentzea xinjiangensis]SER46592.1 DNA-binding response regulator, NarL/FixJ family, contains REC and HTH domains [Lentzea xinjiangensis]